MSEPNSTSATTNLHRPKRPQLVTELQRILDQAARGEVPDTDEAQPLAAEALLADALRERVSDIHLDPLPEGMLVRMRIDGALLDGCRLESPEAQLLSNQVRTMAQLDIGAGRGPSHGRLQFHLTDRTVDLRVALAPCLNGQKITIRILDPQRLDQRIDGLGLMSENLRTIDRWLGNVHGMLLVTGPTGSGKTTTLYALLDQLRQLERNIVTVEDPVEYLIEGINQMQVDRRSELTYQNGVQSMLRHDPDFLLLGEIRGEPSARAAVDAAASGRCLMSTLHSRDAVGVLDVLRNFGLNDYEISNNLEMVIAQRLVRMLCPECRRQGPPEPRDRRWLEAAGLAVPQVTWHPQGCEACSGIGFHGRTGVFEIWRLTDEDYVAILDRLDQRSLRRQLGERGHHFLVDDALTKAAQGITCLSELRNLSGIGPTGMLPGTRKAS